jgi:hypothetical protein
MGPVYNILSGTSHYTQCELPQIDLRESSAQGPSFWFGRHYFTSASTLELIPGCNKQTLSLGFRAGFLYPFGSASQVPFPDRLFLGGATDVRLFRERGLGPHDEGLSFAATTFCC